MGLVVLAVVIGFTETPKVVPKQTTPPQSVKADVTETAPRVIPSVVQSPASVVPKPVIPETVKSAVKPTYQVRFLPAQ